MNEIGLNHCDQRIRRMEHSEAHNGTEPGTGARTIPAPYDVGTEWARINRRAEKSSMNPNTAAAIRLADHIGGEEKSQSVFHYGR